MAEHRVIERVLFELGNFAFGIIDVAENYGFGRAGLLAGSLDFIRADGTVFFFGIDADGVDALNAIGALFHDPTPAHGDLGVIHRCEARLVVLGVLVEIKAADFVRAIVGAEACTDTAIVNLQVEPFVIVDGGRDRTDQFAGGVFAVHARHGLMVELGIVRAAFVVGVHTNPKHVAPAIDLVFAHNWYVVLDFAGDETGVAADTSSKINRHAPFVAGVWIFFRFV